MGLFDEVYVHCPSCGEINTLQSKADECSMKTYTIEDVPISIMDDLSERSPFYCKKCSVGFSFKLKIKPIWCVEKESS